MTIEISLINITYNNGKFFASPEYISEITYSIKQTLSKLSSDSSTVELTPELLSVEEDLDLVKICYWSPIKFDEIRYGLAELYIEESNKALSRSQRDSISRIKRYIEKFEPFYIDKLIGPRFTIEEFYKLHSFSSAKPMDKSNFYKFLKKTGLIIKTEERKTTVSHRPPALFEFRKD
ncbi:hypothetical protein KC660_04485 [Candidatus Dojkabacteria bacterium]|uniref:NrtR DNA-binding winged helix domain-containing protein n=1 Tax=Candidatus Dojkabacteria bacterium TaxID=2099670 RepID=A0A955RIE0_9BACT|nr:hypothetical protein [Candidatus Dojkabacteria bacterium]